MNKKLLRKKLALMLANLKKKRPYYCEVEWIKTDALNSYFVTGVYGDNNNLKFDIYFSTTTSDLYAPIFGNADQEAQNNWGIINGNNTCIGYANTRRSSGLGFKAYKTDGTLNHIIFYRQGNSCIMTVNGTTTSQKVVKGTTNNSEICIGRAGLTRVVLNPRYNSYYRFMIYDNDVLIRDFIPVLDWNMTPCMYDRVTEQLFYNAGSGNDFSYGRQIHPVDYLESTGVEYIDTGIKFDGSNTKIELKTYEDSLTRRHSICGDDGNYFYYFRGTENWAVGYNGTAAKIALYMSVGNNVFVMDKNNVYVNGVLAKTYTATSKVSSYNTLLFNRKTSLVDNGAVTMYYCKIWNDDVLVRDYIPAIDENGTAYLFDRVSHTCFLNQGTGAFKYPAREVEYLESTGKQYIDTGFKPNPSTTKIDTIFQVTGGSTQMFGCRTVAASNSPNNCNVCFGTNYIRGDWICTNSNVASISMNTDVHITAENKTITIDNVSTSGSTSKNTEYLDYSFYLFACNTAGTIGFQNTAIVKYFKIYDNGTLVRDFIPAFKDGQVGMYDKVSGVLKTNTGTGSFTTGKIVESEYE